MTLRKLVVRSVMNHDSLAESKHRMSLMFARRHGGMVVILPLPSMTVTITEKTNHRQDVRHDDVTQTVL